MKKFILILLFPIIVMSQTNFDKAEKLYELGKYTLAEPLFLESLKENPENSKTIEYLGDIAGFQKKWDKSILYYKKLKIQFPKNANYHYKFGGSMGMKAKESNKFKALGMISEIENSFLTAARLDSKNVETRWALVMLYLELPGIIGGSETKSQKYADELMIISKVDGFLSKGFIDIYFKRFTNAEKNYRKAHEIGNSKTTFEKLYDLYQNKLKEKQKAINFKLQYETDIRG